MKRCMVDLETLGKLPGCVILSIGAVMFDEVTGRLGDSFYIVVNTTSCVDAGLVTDPDTMEWWRKQDFAARAVLNQADIGGKTLVRALNEFDQWLDDQSYGEWLYGEGLHTAKYDTWKETHNLEVWGNGADFDNAILHVAYKAAGKEPSWKFWNNRCYRTLKNLFPRHKLERVGVHHNALDDAKTQACHAIQLLRMANPPKVAVRVTWADVWYTIKSKLKAWRDARNKY
jgi:hypothetical protein